MGLPERTVAWDNTTLLLMQTNASILSLWILRKEQNSKNGVVIHRTQHWRFNTSLPTNGMETAYTLSVIILIRSSQVRRAMVSYKA